MLLWVFAALIGVAATIACMLFAIDAITNKTFCDTIFEHIIVIFLAMALFVGVAFLTAICFEIAVSI